ncbi:MAG: hypothetical protein ACOYNF_03830 [Rhodoferax sp.]
MVQPEPPKRSPAHCLWAVLIAHIDDVCPLPARDFDAGQRING